MPLWDRPVFDVAADGTLRELRGRATARALELERHELSWPSQLLPPWLLSRHPPLPQGLQ